MAKQPHSASKRASQHHRSHAHKPEKSLIPEQYQTPLYWAECGCFAGSSKKERRISALDAEYFFRFAQLCCAFDHR